MHCNVCNMNKNCNSNGEVVKSNGERENIRAHVIIIYHEAQRSARNLYSLAEHLSLRPLKRAIGFTDWGQPCESRFLVSTFVYVVQSRHIFPDVGRVIVAFHEDRFYVASRVTRGFHWRIGIC